MIVRYIYSSASRHRVHTGTYSLKDLQCPKREKEQDAPSLAGVSTVTGPSSACFVDWCLVLFTADDGSGWTVSTHSHPLKQVPLVAALS